ncbi:hypothetical protein MPOCJGCO_4899 [Methylobacterium trifolii]|uniref:Uncharacterized protein n=1 Tax=Methylobacterium trifolii TaxID=1003092 RepID=A0ABQ4U6U3_9HYPH|nr:hypothetical protein MPOCJGCO_4899 [Methylobacterium trifolii]
MQSRTIILDHRCRQVSGQLHLEGTVPGRDTERRCLVPVTSFSEYADTKARKTPVWFALDDDRPLFTFAEI